MDDFAYPDDWDDDLKIKWFFNTSEFPGPYLSISDEDATADAEEHQAVEEFISDFDNSDLNPKNVADKLISSIYTYFESDTFDKAIISKPNWLDIAMDAEELGTTVELSTFLKDISIKATYQFLLLFDGKVFNFPKVDFNVYGFPDVNDKLPNLSKIFEKKFKKRLSEFHPFTDFSRVRGLNDDELDFFANWKLKTQDHYGELCNLIFWSVWATSSQIICDSVENSENELLDQLFKKSNFNQLCNLLIQEGAPPISLFLAYISGKGPIPQLVTRIEGKRIFHPDVDLGEFRFVNLEMQRKTYAPLLLLPLERIINGR